MSMSKAKLLYSLDQPHGLGELYFLWQKGEGRSLLATTGTDATVAVFNRSGSEIGRIKLPGLCASMVWDHDGDNLAIITPNSNCVILWESHTNERTSVETGLKEPPSCIAWAYGEAILAIGTQKGNLALYNHHTTKRVPIIGKHTKKITCAAWNKDGVLALASEDKTLSVNNSEGDTMKIISLRDIPYDLQFSEMKTNERVAGDNTISLIVGKRTLYLFNLLNPDNPIELAFQQRYGSIVSYKWYGDGYILIGFSAGYLISISTHIKEVGEELFQVKNHKDNLTDVAMCHSVGLAATCGDGQLKLVSVWNNGEVASSFAPIGGAERCSWNSDERLLATAGRAYLNVFVTALPPLYAVYGTRVVTLTSLSELTIYQCIGSDEEVLNKVEPIPLATYALPTEPTLVALGGSHVCCVRDSNAWFYPLTGGNAIKRQYSAPVTAIKMNNDYAAALAGGKAILHLIEQPDQSGDRSLIMFPEPHMQETTILDIHLTSDFFIFITDKGEIVTWCVEEWGRGAVEAWEGARGLWGDVGGARGAVQGAGGLRVLAPAHSHLLPVHDAPTELRGVIWDICLSERNVFIVYTDDAIHTYYYSPNSINGSHVDFVAVTNIMAGQIPLILFSGEVYCYNTGGEVTKVSLESHNTAGLADVDVEKRLANQKRHIDKLILLRRFTEAWLFCDAVDDVTTWNKLGEAAIADLNVEFAIRVYTRLNDVAMVWALEDCLNIEEISILCGMLSVCVGSDTAAVRWLESGGANSELANVLAAKGEWARAADLLANTDPHTAHQLNLMHAQHTELYGDYHEALSKYEKSVITTNLDDPKVKQHNEKCEAGIARTSIRAGDVIRAVNIALKHTENKDLLKDCAMLLEEERQYSHAANLYDQIGNIEKAASLYIKLKSWLKVEALISKINSPSIHIQYAKAKEAEGRYPDALKSYIKAQDFESAIRLNLDKLEDIDAAVELVQETKSVQGAKMVANYFQNTDDQTSAIRFLVMSLCYDEAFQLARKVGKLQLYGEILIQTSQARAEDFKSLALHFEGEKNHLLSGKFYFHAADYNKALTHLMKVAGTEDDENEAITIAIDAAAASDDERLTRRLIEYLLGETDGTPREPRHLFRLYMAKKQFTEAAKTAVIICSSECSVGNYRGARDVLRSMCVWLRARALPIRRDVRTALTILHSYILVRYHVRRERHDLAARLLIRIANEVTFFPTIEHQVSILTSTVIECNRAGLKHAAHQWAKVLMQPEYRPLIEAKYVKKVETVVRHPPRPPAAPLAPPAPCPSCTHPLTQTLTTCTQCGQDLPFCLVTGFHIVKDDLTACPECDFPAIMAEFVEFLKDEGKCPMCNEVVDYRRLVKTDDIARYLDLNASE